MARSPVELDAVGRPSTRRVPFLLHVVWHRNCATAAAIARELSQHYGRNRYDHVAGGGGVVVLLHSTADQGESVLPAIDWTEGDVVAVVILMNKEAESAPWAEYIGDLDEQTRKEGLSSRIFPVTLDGEVLPDGMRVQALRWDQWVGAGDQAVGRLVQKLTYQFIRMLRHHLTGHAHGDQLHRYQEKIQVFLSHSKHDAYGASIAETMRGWFHANAELSSFLDVEDIPPGLPFDAAIEDAVSHGVLVAIYTDSYSSREWCRREALLAKEHGIPMLVVDCLAERDDRAFPYLWNVPVVRMDPARVDRMDRVALTLLDEVFKDYLWQQRTNVYRQSASCTVFTPRPPELTTLATLPENRQDEWAIVHAEPPLAAEEQRLFDLILPDVRVRTLNQWLMEGER